MRRTGQWFSEDIGTEEPCTHSVLDKDESIVYTGSKHGTNGETGNMLGVWGANSTWSFCTHYGGLLKPSSALDRKACTTQLLNFASILSGL